MELKDAIKKRHSTRNFSDKTIPNKIVLEIIEYAHLAPSAGNLQSRDFIIVNEDDIKEKLSEAALDQKFIIEAPINIIVCANLNRVSPYGIRGKELYCIQDATAAVEHILLLAKDYELNTCWIGAFDEKKYQKYLVYQLILDLLR